ncbi:MAG: hypothetical protein ACREYE_05420, partial [Gammaproteobacteria bacterium]
ERFRYSSELRANRLPAGQIAVLSRTVLARILRLDRRTGISAKADLTAPPQTCRKDTTYPPNSHASLNVSQAGCAWGADQSSRIFTPEYSLCNTTLHGSGVFQGLTQGPVPRSNSLKMRLVTVSMYNSINCKEFAKMVRQIPLRNYSK